MSLDEIVVQALSIPHFKGLGTRNLQYEIGVCQKNHNKVTLAMSNYFDFSQFCQLQETKLFSIIFMNMFGEDYNMDLFSLSLNEKNS